MTNKLSDNPRNRAIELLKRLNLRTAPIAVDRIAKFLGAQLRFSPLDEELSGMIFIKEGIPIIGVNSLHHPHRQRFTIAHELGHLELHRELISNEVHVDKQFRVLMRDGVSASGTDKIEVEANQYAAELLIPTFLLEQFLENKRFDIDDDSPLDELAKKFRVSKQTMQYRVINLK